MTDENVEPITPAHVCASCKATISTLDVYAGHTAECMQPEVRMRRLEASVRALEAGYLGLATRLGVGGLK